MPFFTLWSYSPPHLFSGGGQFGPPKHIERHLPAHRIPCVFHNCGEPRPVGAFRAGGVSKPEAVMQVAQTKTLFYPPAWRPSWLEAEADK